MSHVENFRTVENALIETMKELGSIDLSFDVDASPVDCCDRTTVANKLAKHLFGGKYVLLMTPGEGFILMALTATAVSDAEDAVQVRVLNKMAEHMVQPEARIGLVEKLMALAAELKVATIERFPVR